MKRMVVFAAACLLVTACNDSMAPTAGAPAYSLQPSAQQLFQRYVSLGTSITHGVQAAGVFDDAQKQAWSAQLAARVGASYTLPLVYDPGCPAPLLAPLARRTPAAELAATPVAPQRPRPRPTPPADHRPS